MYVTRPNCRHAFVRASPRDRYTLHWRALLFGTVTVTVAVNCIVSRIGFDLEAMAGRARQ